MIFQGLCEVNLATLTVTQESTATKAVILHATCATACSFYTIIWIQMIQTGYKLLITELLKGRCHYFATSKDNCFILFEVTDRVTLSVKSV